MTLDDYNTFCDSLTATTKVVQWGGSHVWKVGGKVFAISDLGTGSDKADDGDHRPIAVAFKASELSFQMLTELEGIIPAPYLARGNWVRVEAEADFSDEDRQAYIAESHRIISRKLTRKLRDELGLS